MLVRKEAIVQDLQKEYVRGFSRLNNFAISDHSKMVTRKFGLSLQQQKNG